MSLHSVTCFHRKGILPSAFHCFRLATVLYYLPDKMLSLKEEIVTFTLARTPLSASDFTRDLAHLQQKLGCCRCAVNSKVGLLYSPGPEAAVNTYLF